MKLQQKVRIKKRTEVANPDVFPFYYESMNAHADTITHVTANEPDNKTVYVANNNYQWSPDWLELIEEPVTPVDKDITREQYKKALQDIPEEQRKAMESGTWETPKLKLQVGKKYKQRDGKKVVLIVKEHIPESDEEFIFPFQGHDTTTYTPYGKWSESETHPFDLIEEVKEPSKCQYCGKTACEGLWLISSNNGMTYTCETCNIAQINIQKECDKIINHSFRDKTQGELFEEQIPLEELKTMNGWSQPNELQEEHCTKTTKTQFDTGAVRSTDANNVAYQLISPIGLRRLAETYREGSIKHGEYNWEKGMPIGDILNHGIRHIYCYLHGDRSEDHLAHAAWNLFAAMHMEESFPSMDHGLRSTYKGFPKDSHEQYRKALSEHFHREVIYFENTDTHLVIKFLNGDSLVLNYIEDEARIKQLPSIKLKR